MPLSDDVQAVFDNKRQWAVVCGEAMELFDAFPAHQVDAVVSDPPYASTGDAASVMQSRDGTMAVPREVQFYESWAREHLREWVRVLRGDGAAWFTCDWRGAMAFDMAAHKLKYKSPVVGVWNRGGLGMGHILRKTFEAFVVIPMPKFKRRKTDEPDVWTVEWSAARRDSDCAAEKPVALFERAVELVSDPGALIVDPFAGSGTTGEAALRKGRRVILFERDPDLAQKIARRCECAIRDADWRTPAEQLPLLPAP